MDQNRPGEDHAPPFRVSARKMHDRRAAMRHASMSLVVEPFEWLPFGCRQSFRQKHVSSIAQGNSPGRHLPSMPTSKSTTKQGSARSARRSASLTSLQRRSKSSAEEVRCQSGLAMPARLFFSPRPRGREAATRPRGSEAVSRCHLGTFPRTVQGCDIAICADALREILSVASSQGQFANGAAGLQLFERQAITQEA